MKVIEVIGKAGLVAIRECDLPMYLARGYKVREEEKPKKKTEKKPKE